MKEAKFAFRKSFPIFFTYVFLGIAFGVMMSDAGYSALVCLASALFIYAGSMQIVMVSLLTAGAPLWTTAIMTLFINGRHIFYGVGFIDKYRKSGWRFPYLVFSLTDETYSILCSIEYDEGLDENRCNFLISLFNQSYWVLGCFVGGCIGNYLPIDLTGIDFSATAFFLIVVVDQLRKFKSKIPFAIGLISALVFYFILGADYFLIPALSVSLVTLVILRDYVSKKMEVPV